MSARETLVTTLTNLFARTRVGRMDAHRADAEKLVDDALRESAHALSEGLHHGIETGEFGVHETDGVWEAASRIGDDFDALIRASEERAARKRAAREHPYDLEESQ
ncbi:hypothetical protein [Streptomyces sp. NPDC056291]|uniref:hypothetical protein n=1 Tax=Streptomyces sp. NPDC056291 TaxID=3345772 RepID=UPI0035DA681F